MKIIQRAPYDLLTQNVKLSFHNTLCKLCKYKNYLKVFHNLLKDNDKHHNRYLHENYVKLHLLITEQSQTL